MLEHLAGLTALKAMERRYRRRNSLPADRAAVLHFRAHLARYLSQFAGFSGVRRRLQSMCTPEQVTAAIDEVLVTN